MLTERDQEFRPIEEAAKGVDENTGEQFWSLGDLTRALEIKNVRRIKHAANKAKIAAGKADLPIAEHFSDGSLFGDPEEILPFKICCISSCDELRSA